MRIAEGIHLVASGMLGVSLTHRLDCNAYAVRCGDRYCIIDSGVGCESERIAAELQSDGIAAEQIEGLLLTHYHLDHSGGAHWLHQHLSLPVWAGHETALALESGDQEAISLGAAKRAGVYPGDFPFHSCPVARRLADGDTVSLVDTRIEAIATPGHSCDMMSYLVRQPGRALLFPGDTVFHGGRLSLQATHDCDPPAYAESLRRLSALSFDAMFPGHGLWSLTEAHRHLDAAMDYVDRLLLPPNL